ncbi:hypothetical protein [Undibacterium crateris]|uniref:hypothetical protein n=1 Tax=Undibacterium crateris TaxID=2528175 RepID=UPI00192EAF6D|nr:hypothetical protein [Undibacterium crateris]
MKLSRLSLMLATLLTTHSSFAEMPATLEQQQSALRSGKLSATELLQYYGQQIAARNPATGAVQALDPQAKEVAARIDQQKKIQRCIDWPAFAIERQYRCARHDHNGRFTRAGR